MTKSITLWIVFLYSRSSATTPAINKAKHGPVDEMTHSRWILMCNIVFGTRKPTATNTSKHSTATAPSVASMPIATLSLLFNVRLNFINCSSLNDVINIRMYASRSKPAYVSISAGRLYFVFSPEMSQQPMDWSSSVHYKPVPFAFLYFLM